MTRTLDFKQLGDLDPALLDPVTRELNADRLLGNWLNTNHETRGITGCVVERTDKEFSLTITAVGPDGPIHWPKVNAKVLANLEEESGQRAVALSAIFTFDFMTAETYIRINKGVLVIVLFITFLDESLRSNYVSREFFYRPK